MSLKITERDILVAVCFFALGFCFHGLNSQGLQESSSKNQSKQPFVAYVVSDDCFACQIFFPVLEKLKEKYKGKIDFVKLDITKQEEKPQTEKIARQYGVSDFFAKQKGLPAFAIFCPGGGTPVKVIVGAGKEESYQTEVDNLLNHLPELCSSNGASALQSKL